MRKIRNQFADRKGYNCFGCAPNHDIGLKMSFYEDGEYIISKWSVDPNFQSYENIIHGGIQATMLDEIASWVVYMKMRTSGVTSRLNVRYVSPVKAVGELMIKAKLKEVKHNIAFIDANLYDNDGKLCCKADVQYFTLSRERAIKELGFPDNDDNLYE